MKNAAVNLLSLFSLLTIVTGCNDGWRLRRVDKALLDASSNGDSKAVLKLLGAGANPNVVSTEGRHMTPLLWAAYEEDWDTCVVLMKNGANPSVREPGGPTVLFHLVEAGPGASNAVALALKLGAAPGEETNLFKEMPELGPLRRIYENYAVAAKNGGGH